MNFKKIAGISGLIVLLVGALWVGFAFLNGETSDEILKRVEQDGFSGVILIAKDDKILHHAGYGYASCDDQIPNTVDTVQAIGSITKMFTRIAIGQLDDQKLLNIDDPISQYFDDLPSDKRSITIGQLLDHRGGLEEYHETTNRGDFELMTGDEAFREIIGRSLRSQPGRREHYSNSGYTLLALLIEEVSGQSYTDYVREHILLPAGMTSTGFNINPVRSSRNRRR